MILLGRREPTFEWRPPAFDNAAPEAIEFYESVATPLDGWQNDRIRAGMGEDREGMWATPEVAIEVQRQNGKTHLGEVPELAGLFLWGCRLITHSAHLQETANKAFKHIAEIVESAPDLTRRVRNIDERPSKEAIELMDGATLRFRTRTGRGMRGQSGEIIVFDEAQEITEDQAEAMVPTVLAQYNPMIWYLFTPPKVDGQLVTRLRTRAKAHDPGLAYAEWANEHGADLSDLRAMARVNPAYGIRVSERTLAVARGALGDEGYARECGGIWPRPLGAQWLVISDTDWAAARDADSQLGDTVVLAVSVSWDRKKATISAAGPRADRLLHGETVENRRGTGWVVDRLAQLVAKWNPAAIVVNPGGPAGSLIEDIKANEVIKARMESRKPLELREVTARETAQAFGAFVDAVAGVPYLDEATGGVVDPRVFRHIGDDELTDAVSAATSRKVGDGHALEMKVADDLSPLDGVILALHGVRSLEKPTVNPPATAPSAAVDTSTNMFRPTARLAI